MLFVICYALFILHMALSLTQLDKIQWLCIVVTILWIIISAIHIHSDYEVILNQQSSILSNQTNILAAQNNVLSNVIGQRQLFELHNASLKLTNDIKN